MSAEIKNEELWISLLLCDSALPAGSLSHSAGLGNLIILLIDHLIHRYIGLQRVPFAME